MTLKIFPWLLSAVLALILGLQIWMASGNHDNRIRENREFNAKLDSSNHQISLWEGKAGALEDELAENDRILEREKEARKSEIKSLKRRERLSRPDTMVLTLTDTVYLAYDSLVDVLEVALDTTRSKRALQVFLLRNTISELKTMVSELDSVKEVHFAEVKPSNWSLGATAGPGFLVTGKEVKAGYGATVGLTYRFPIKKIRIRDLFRRKK